MASCKQVISAASDLEGDPHDTMWWDPRIARLADGSLVQFYYAFRSGPLAALVMDTGEDKPDDSPHFGGMVAFLLRAALTGLALWLVTLLVPGMTFVGGDTTLQKIGIIFVVAVVFGLVNAIIKPIVQIISIPLYILTLGLIHIVINALMLWITSWITEHTTHWGLFIDDFWWTAIWAAIVLSIISWVLSLIVRDTRRVTHA